MPKSAEYAALPETGAARLLLDLQKLPFSGTVLMIGAHPDDEDNALLAYVTKRLHLDAYYLVANWGEGGQNEIGPELYRALGVLRAQELESARSVDGARQLYLGTHDFGFSKTAEEALEKWGHQATLGRLVRLLRTHRPDIVLTYHDTVTGHGQHQAVGSLILEAFSAAADPRSFPDQLEAEGLSPWQVRKLYVADKEASVQINVGEFSPLLGRSFSEVGALSRSMHKSQGMVRPGIKGDLIRRYKLVKTTLSEPAAHEELLTDGLDLSLYGTLAGVNASLPILVDLRRGVAEIAAAADTAQQSFVPTEPELAMPAIIQGLTSVRRLIEAAAAGLSGTERDYVLRRLRDKERDFVHAAEDLCGLSLDLATSDVDVVPGQSFVVTAEFWNRGRLQVEDLRMTPVLPSGWEVRADSPSTTSLSYNQKAVAQFTITVPDTASFTDAFDPSPVQIGVKCELQGALLAKTGAPVVRVVPAVAVELNPAKMILPAGATAEETVTVKLRSCVRERVEGQVELALPPGWTQHGETKFALKGQGQEASVRLEISAPSGTREGSYALGAAARYGAGRSASGYQVIAYPHIETKYLYSPAEAAAVVVDVKTPPDLKVGYVVSGFDNVPDYLREIGVDVTLFGPRDLCCADLSQFDTIVTGIRAYLSRRDLIANNGRLLAYVRNGGNLIVQYNKACEWSPDYAPYPLEVGMRRVTREEAPVEVLAPGHPFFNAPNKIVASDWDGWVQERGLYFPEKWAPEYTELVAMNDPGEPGQRGPWLTAQYGRGTYTYTALAWYRQIDGLVPGAYRLLANMLSLPRAVVR